MNTDKALRLFHYSTGIHLPSILADGHIKPATVGVPKHVKPVVWCSFNRDWEQTANKGVFNPKTQQIVTLDKDDTHNLFRGIVRIEVDPAAAPYDWNDYKRMSGDGRAMLHGLFNAAIECGSRPREWRCSFGSIPKEHFLAIEYWNGITWVTEPPLIEDAAFTPSAVQSSI